jgi:hypothetical protein
MQSPGPFFYKRIITKVLRQTAKFTDVDEASIFKSKLVVFLTHVGRLERKLKLASKKTLSDQIYSQVDEWLESASTIRSKNPSPKNAWMAVLYMSVVMGNDVDTIEKASNLLKQR